VALLFNPATTVPVTFYMSSIEAAASSFAIQASTAPVHAKDEIEGVIANVPERSREARLDGRQQSANRSSLGWG
jgi:hypothetical protein